MRRSYDPEEAVQTLIRADVTLAGLIERAGPFEPDWKDLPGLFEALTRSIIYQQLSGKAAATIYGRVAALFPGTSTPEPAAMLAFPDDTLRSAGMSRAKVAAVKDLAEKTLSGSLPTVEALHHMTDDEIIACLTTVRGIGRWTVEMLLMFRMGRPDVLPATDLGVRKGYMLTYGLSDLPAPRFLLQHGEQWRPFRSVASWYMWRAVDLAK